MWNCIVFTTIWIYIFSTKSLSNKVIRAKKSPCEGWLRFLVGQKQSSSRLVILNSRPLTSAYFAMSFMKMSIMVDFFFLHLFIRISFSLDIYTGTLCTCIFLIPNYFFILSHEFSTLTIIDSIICAYMWNLKLY